MSNLILPEHMDNSGAARKRRALRAKHYVIGQQKGNEPERDYNAPDFSNAEDIALAKLEYALSETIGNLLKNKFPGRRWAVGIDAAGGMMVIACPSVSVKKGYHIALKNPVNGMARTLMELCQFALRGAGEIMERYGLTRDRVINTDTINALPFKGDEAVTADSAGVHPIKRVMV